MVPPAPSIIYSSDGIRETGKWWCWEDWSVVRGRQWLHKGSGSSPQPSGCSNSFPVKGVRLSIGGWGAGVESKEKVHTWWNQQERWGHQGISQAGEESGRGIGTTQETQTEGFLYDLVNSTSTTRESRFWSQNLDFAFCHNIGSQRSLCSISYFQTLSSVKITWRNKGCILHSTRSSHKTRKFSNQRKPAFWVIFCCYVRIFRNAQHVDMRLPWFSALPSL